MTKRPTNQRDIVNAYFRRFYPEPLDRKKFEFDTILGGMWYYNDCSVSKIFPPLKCADGFSISVQGHRGAYSCPRDDFADEYTAVECGFPSAHEPLLDEYQEGDGDPTDTVYGYVPVSVVLAVIEKHGGLAKTAGGTLDFLINNRAPDEDSCTIKILAGDERLHITVWKEEDQSVHVNIEDNLGETVDLVLGQEGETHKL